MGALVSQQLAQLLPLLIPKAVAWAVAREAEILSTGRSLDEVELAIAQRVGVSSPDAVRVLVVQELPLPDDPGLRDAALATGLLGPSMIGLTLGYGIYVREGFGSPRVLSHECRHVHQYEQAGSIDAYLPAYLQQVVLCGYLDAPYEVDARAYEDEMR